MHWGGGGFKKEYELLNLRALRTSTLYKNHIFQCLDKICCVIFQRYPLKFHTKYIDHALKYMYFVHMWKFKGNWFEGLDFKKSHSTSVIELTNLFFIFPQSIGSDDNPVLTVSDGCLFLQSVQRLSAPYPLLSQLDKPRHQRSVCTLIHRESLTVLNKNLAVLKLYEIIWSDILCDIKIASWPYCFINSSSTV